MLGWCAARNNHDACLFLTPPPPPSFFFFVSSRRSRAQLFASWEDKRRPDTRHQLNDQYPSVYSVPKSSSYTPLQIIHVFIRRYILSLIFTQSARSFSSEVFVLCPSFLPHSSVSTLRSVPTASYLSEIPQTFRQSACSLPTTPSRWRPSSRTTTSTSP